MISDPTWIPEYRTELPLLVPIYERLCCILESTEERSLESLDKNDNYLSSTDLTDMGTTTSKKDVSCFNSNNAGTFLAKRSFRGLEPHIGETLINKTIIEGRSGLAKKYTDEPGGQERRNGNENSYDI
jgi:hypothetical protein